MAGRPPERDLAPTSLTSDEFGQLFDAFLAAFTSRDQLRRVVAFTFAGVDLDDIADGNLRSVTDALIRWAAAQDAIPALIAGARRENAGNQQLAAVDAYWRDRPAPAAIVGDDASNGRAAPVSPTGTPPALRYAIAAVAAVLVIGAVWWLTQREGNPATAAWQVESYPVNATGLYYGNGWETNPDRVQGLAESGSDTGSGFMRFAPQGRLAPAWAERSLGDGTTDPSLQPYCSLDFRLRLGLDGINPLPASTSGAAVYLKQGDEEKAAPIRSYVAHLDSGEWQPVNIPLRVFERAGLDAAAPVSALGFRFAMPMGNTVDIDDIAFAPCPANGGSPP